MTYKTLLLASNFGSASLSLRLNHDYLSLAQIHDECRALLKEYSESSFHLWEVGDGGFG